MAQNCLYIGTVLPFRRKSISVILGTVKTLHSSRSGLERLFSISVKVVVSILFQKARKVLNNERGEANYFSTVVFIFIAVLLLAFIIDLFSIIPPSRNLTMLPIRWSNRSSFPAASTARPMSCLNFEFSDRRIRKYFLLH